MFNSVGICRKMPKFAQFCEKMPKTWQNRLAKRASACALDLAPQDVLRFCMAKPDLARARLGGGESRPRESKIRTEVGTPAPKRPPTWRGVRLSMRSPPPPSPPKKWGSFTYEYGTFSWNSENLNFTGQNLDKIAIFLFLGGCYATNCWCSGLMQEGLILRGRSRLAGDTLRAPSLLPVVPSEGNHDILKESLRRLRNVQIV